MPLLFVSHPYSQVSSFCCRVEAFYLDVDDGSKLAEVLVELGDVVEVPGDLPYL